VRNKGRLLLWLPLSIVLCGVFCLGAGGRTPTEVRPLSYQVVRSYPHDREAFTQGLVYADGVLYEGTGLHGRSSLRKVELLTGRVLQEVRLASAHFGEGITLFGDRIIQVTWQSRLGFVYDKASFNLLRTFTYPHEGWGLTEDGKRLIMSDGTDRLHFLDPKDFRETASVRVHDERGPVMGLNELEYVRDVVYANLWPTEEIVVIEPGTGRVKGRFQLRGLLDEREAAGVDVLNGIAYDARGDRFFVTGKYWPKVFELKWRLP
jgi:glutamine cyclotransferase